MFFALKKLKKPPSKVAQKNSNPLFSLTASTAQMAQTEEFIFQNVAYRPTVYRTGVVRQSIIVEKNTTGLVLFQLPIHLERFYSQDLPSWKFRILDCI